MGTSKSSDDSDTGDTTTTTSPPEDTPDWMADTSDTMGLMYAIMMKAALEGQGVSAPELADVPSVLSVSEVDYTEKLEELKQRAKAEYALTQDEMKGRQDTIWTSSLLDDEESNVTTQPLKGK